VVRVNRNLVAVVTLCAFLVLPGAAVAGIHFIGAEVVNVGPKPDFTVAGDLDADGRSDLVVVSPSSRQVDVFLAADTPALIAPAQSLQFGNTLRGPTLADLNCDDRLDLVVADQAADAVWVLLGAGDGTFLTPHLVDVPRSRAPVAVAAADFDGAGNPDLAVVDGRAERVFILLNDNGAPPRFRAGAEIEVGNQPASIQVADFNRDGHDDLITLNAGGPRVKDVSVVMWKRTVNGVPEFEDLQKYTVGEKPENLSVGDFNADGAPDVAMLNRPAGGGNSEVITLLNEGDGRLSPVRIMSVPCPFFTGGQPCKALVMTLGDFDDNGNVDLMVAMADPRRSRGSASSLADAMQAFGGRGDGTFVPGGVFATRKAPLSMAAGDFDGDGTLDVAVAHLRTLDLQAFINVRQRGQAPNGSLCTRDGECFSGRCIHGVCCATDCRAMERCNLPGHEGTCSVLNDPIQCSLPDQPECDEGFFCVDGFCCDQECVGGRCALSGFIGVCIPGIEVGSPCEAGEECTTGFCANRVCCLEPCVGGFCNDAGVCMAKEPNGEACEADAQCQSGVCDPFDAICCNRRCSAVESCFEGACVPFASVPTWTPERRPMQTPRLTPGPHGPSCQEPAECWIGVSSLAASNPCGVCPSGTHRENGSCIDDARDSSGCSIAGRDRVDGAGHDLAVWLIPIIAWIAWRQARRG